MADRKKITLSLSPDAGERFELLYDRLNKMGVVKSRAELVSDLTGWALANKSTDSAFWAKVKTWHLEGAEK